MISGANALVEPGRIHPIFLEGKLLPLQAKAAAELGLKDGQVVQGNVRLQHDQPMLMLQGKAFVVPGLLASQVGQSMWFKVQDGNLVRVTSNYLNLNQSDIEDWLKQP